MNEPAQIDQNTSCDKIRAQFLRAVQRTGGGSIPQRAGFVEVLCHPADIAGDGTFRITKPIGSGGIVNTETVIAKPNVS